MCGRFTLTVNPEQLQESFPFMHIPPEAMNMQPRYNIAPTQPLAVLPNDGRNTLDYFIWGLIPSWSKDTSFGSRMINARGETVAEKPAFRAAYKRRRCLVFADGFYEWVKHPGAQHKTPYYIQLESQEIFAFAGLWESWQSPDGSEIKSTTIITTTPNDKIAQLHDRMPVILPLDSFETWMSTEEQPREALDPLLIAYPAGELSFYPVSTTVNSPANDVPECIVPVK